MNLMKLSTKTLKIISFLIFISGLVINIFHKILTKDNNDKLIKFTGVGIMLIAAGLHYYASGRSTRKKQR